MTPKLLNILLLILSGFLYFYIIEPLYTGSESFIFTQGQDLKTLMNERDTYDKTIAEVPKLIDKAAKAKASYDKISDTDRHNIMVMVPVSVDNIKLMSELTNIGVESGIPIDGMGVKDKSLGEYSVSFSVMATYSDFKNKVMPYWEKSMRLFTLQSVSFAPGKTEDEVVKFSVQLSTYYMK